MMHMLVLGHAEVAIEATPSGYIKKRGKIPVLGDNPAWYPPLFAIAMSPDLLDFLIEELPDRDGFTEELRKLREDAKHTLWERTSGR